MAWGYLVVAQTQVDKVSECSNATIQDFRGEERERDEYICTSGARNFAVI